MDQLNVFLASLGPWGPLAGIGVALVLNYLRTGKVLPSAPANPIAPATPTVPVTPTVPDAAPLIPIIPNRPLLNAGLQLLQQLAQKRLVQAQAPVTPYAASLYDPHAALEDDVLRRVAAEIGTQSPPK